MEPVRHLCRLICAAAVCVIIAGSVSAQPAGKNSTGDRKKAKETYIAGKKLFQAGEYESAIVRFQAAYRLSGNNPLLLYNIGFTYDTMGDVEQALVYYERFLVKGDARKRASIHSQVTDRVRDLRRVRFIHEVVTEAPPGLPIDIAATIPERSEWRANLFYRRGGEGDFDRVPMTARQGQFVGRIPGSHTRGKTLHYYIEAVKAHNQPDAGEAHDERRVTRSGRSAEPHLVLINPGVPPRHGNATGGQQRKRERKLQRKLQLKPTTKPAPAPRHADIEPRPTPQTPGSVDTGWRGWTIARWSATAGTAVFFGSFLGFYRAASDQARRLASNAGELSPGCTAQPCNAFSEYQRNVERRGQRFETMARVSLVLSTLSASAAGYLWYREFVGPRKRRLRTARARGRVTKPVKRLSSVPIVEPDFIGGVLTWRF
ncbi:MAG: tetratricopeptide repeat protein [Proteobacteria bacterium]|nr:tetratricopeptide repeat protein [Pseudomonadota bacterium]